MRGHGGGEWARKVDGKGGVFGVEQWHHTASTMKNCAVGERKKERNREGETTRHAFFSNMKLPDGWTDVVVLFVPRAGSSALLLCLSLSLSPFRVSSSLFFES